MINYSDTASIQALVDAKRDELYRGAQQRIVAGETAVWPRIEWRGIRQFTGRGFIQIGARISGLANQGLCLSPNCDNEACVPV